MSNAWEGGSTRRWRRIRAAVLLRDGYECKLRIPNVCTRVAALRGPQAGHAHHVLGRAVTGDDMAYIVAACRACNLSVGEPAKNPDPPPRPGTRW